MTIRVNDSVVVAKPVSAVFAFVADHENLPAWTVGVKHSERLTAGAPAPGTRYRVVGKLLGRSVESVYEVTSFERDHAFEGSMTSPIFGFSERYEFLPDGDGTRVAMHVDVEPQGLFRLLAPVMAAGVRRQVKADHLRLKSVLERP